MESAVVVLQLAGWAWLGGPGRLLQAARPGCCSAWCWDHGAACKMVDSWPLDPPATNTYRDKIHP